MDVIIVNGTDDTVHIAIVRYSRRSVHFVLTRAPEPVPAGTVSGRHEVGPGHALTVDDLDDDALPRVYNRFAQDLPVRVVRGRTKDGTFVLVTLKNKPEG
jgi:hypothetical protein